MSKSLKERSKNLTSISLESFLNDVTTEGQNHNFSELLEHPNIRSIKPQYLQLINLFAFGTYRNYIEGGYDVPKLNQKQIDTLRRLSVLTAFKGAQTITIAKLQQILDLKPEQVIDLLVSMNIIDLITAKIDEEKGIVLILAAELRAEKNSVSKSILNAKISQILEKNKDIEEKIVAIQKQVQ